MKKTPSKQKTNAIKAPVKKGDLLKDLRLIIEQTKEAVATAINTSLTALNWKIGYRIRSEILNNKRADYGKEIVATVSRQLPQEYGEGFSEKNISGGRKRFDEIDKEIKTNKDNIDWIDNYVECLNNGEVAFDQPKWCGRDIESDILDDFYTIARKLPLSQSDLNKLYRGDLDFTQLKELLNKNGYSSSQAIASKLIELFTHQKELLEREIKTLEETKLHQEDAHQLHSLLSLIPQQENTDKILKYERSLQKSIFQNLFLLRKLQGIF